MILFFCWHFPLARPICKIKTLIVLIRLLTRTLWRSSTVAFSIEDVSWFVFTSHAGLLFRNWQSLHGLTWCVFRTFTSHRDSETGANTSLLVCLIDETLQILRTCQRHLTVLNRLITIAGRPGQLGRYNKRTWVIEIVSQWSKSVPKNNLQLI